MRNAADTILTGPEALSRLPALSKLKGAALTLDALAQLVPAQSGAEPETRLTRAIDVLHASGGRLRIILVARFVACSPRHLNRLFRKNTGLDAKTYAQIIQFHRTLKLIVTGHVPIVAAASEGGYADQAHMTRAFRRFGGFTPTTVPPDLTGPALFSR